LGADGVKSLTATVTDATGNASAASAALGLTLDATAPVIQSVSVPAAGTYILNAPLTFDVTFSEPVLLGSATNLQLQLVNGLTSNVVLASLASTQPVASLANGFVTTARFVYTLKDPDNAATVNILGLSQTPADAAGTNLTAYTWPALTGVVLAPTNALPVLSSTAALGNVTESLTSNAILSTTGNIGFTDLNTADVHVVSATTAGQSSPLGTLSVVKTSDTTGTGTGGSIAWSYSLANEAVQAFTQGQTQVDRFTVTLDDQRGGIVTKQVEVTINGINTPATIAGNSSGNVVEAGGVANANQPAGTSGNASGVLTLSDVDSAAAFQAVSIPSGGYNAQYGNFTLAPNGAWTYALNNANSAVQALGSSSSTLTDRITVYSVDGTPKEISVSIAGANDVPTIGSISAPSTLVDTSAKDSFAPISGSIVANDVDAGDLLSYAIVANSGPATTSKTGTYGTLSVDAQGRYSFAVNAQAVNALTSNASESFVVQVSDSKGATTTQALSFNLTGANDALVVTNTGNALAGTVVEIGNNNNGAALAGTATVQGTLAVSDADANAQQTWSLQGTPNTTYGTMAINASGQWTYTLNNNLSTTQALVKDQVVNLSYTVRATDNLGGFVDQVVTVRINGTNDAPTLTTFSGYPPFVYENGTSATYGASFKTSLVETVFGDIDNLAQVQYVTTDDQGKVLWEKTGASTYTRTGNFGVATLDTATGNVTYVLNDSFAETQALKVNQTATDSFTLSVTDGLAVTTKTIGFDIKGADDISAWNSATANAVSVYRYSGNRTVVRVDLSASDVDSSQTYSATLTQGAFSNSFNLRSSGNALVGLTSLQGSASASDYVLTVTSSGGNTLTKVISGNTVGDAALVSPVRDLATGGNFNDLLLGSSFGDYLDTSKHPESHPTFVGNTANDVFDGLGANMAFAGGAGTDTAILQDSSLLMTDSKGQNFYAISMLPTDTAATLANDFTVSSVFANAVAQNGFAAHQSAFVGITTSTGMAYTDAENLVFANSASSVGSGSTSLSNVFVLGRDASNGNALQLQLSDSGVRLVAGGHADNILGGAGNDVIVGNGNGNGALINGQAEAADILRGGAGNDILSGGSYLGLNGSSVDVSFLYGDQGDDVLVAVSGTVYATGGSGRDVFALYSNTDNVNLIIQDFNASTDRIDLSALIDLKNGVLLEGASSTDRSVLIQSLLSSASTNASGDLVLNLDAYLTADARAANHHALITIKQVSANDGQLSTQNFVLKDTSWSPTLWHDNLNPLVMS
jgi:VCBS repeat-containing protein